MSTKQPQAHPEQRGSRLRGVYYTQVFTPYTHMHSQVRALQLGGITHKQIHLGTVELVSTGLFPASRKINVFLSKMSC